MIQKIDETYSVITEPSKERREQIVNFLKVQRPDAYFNKLVKAGIESPYKYFTVVRDDKVFIYNGLRFLLKSFGIDPLNECSDITEFEIDNFLKTVKLPFDPYDYQIHALKLCLMNNKMLCKACTSSGKSMTISLILEFFRRKGLRGILVVPNINLLTQFKNDIISYGLKELSEHVQLLGNGNDSDFKTTVTITTWQSMVEKDVKSLHLDFIICDEVHRETGDTVSSILKNSTTTKIKLGFTGTLPEDPVAKMTLLGLFGEPKTVITSRELIERGLATPVVINSVILNYPKNICNQFRQVQDYQKQLKFIKDCQSRSDIIYKIVTGMRTKGKNVLVLYQHTEHGKQMFADLMKIFYPDVTVENKNITGKKSLEFQKQYNVFFMNGEQSGTIRESQRNLLENITGSVLIANYHVMSTGVNIRNLHCLVLSSPLKAFTTVSQSLGRLMRKHDSKKEAVVFDIVDNFGKGCVFMKQYKHRKESSYVPEEFEIKELTIGIGGIQ